MKRVFNLVVPVLIGIISFFFLSSYFDSDAFKTPYVTALDQKQTAAANLTIASAGASIVIAAIPDDSTTPIADQVANVSSRLVVVTAIILVEKVLVGVSGYISFRWLVPIACLLWMIYGLTSKRAMRILAVRLFIFACCLCLLVPVSLEIDKRLDAAFHTSQIVEQAIETQTESEEEKADEGFLEQATSFITGIGSSIKSLPEQSQKMLTAFMNGVAVMILTVCVTPVATLAAMLLISKALLSTIVMPMTPDEMSVLLRKMERLPEGTA